MFEQLQNRFSKIFKTIRGHGKISDSNIEDAIRDIRRAFLESDVNFKVVSTFIKRVKEKASGAEVLSSITPGQQFIKIILDELVSFLDSDEDDLKLNLDESKPAVIVMSGLQGSGKTTTTAKLAGFLKREYNKNSLLIGADLYRPAAQKQLKILAESIDTDYFFGKETKPIKVVQEGLEYASKNNYDVIFIDTAGRLHVDDQLIKELQDIVDISKPDEVLYIVDGMTGQDAVNSSKVFSETCRLTGTILTKMDGNSGGGAALSVKEITGVPIKFITSGENLQNIEVFDANRIARRILGLSDIIGLVENAQKTLDKDQIEKISERLKSNEFNFDDFLMQIDQFSKMGSISNFSNFVPGLNKLKSLDNHEQGIKWTKAIIQSMTKKERINPEILNASRKLRISKGCGRSVAEINRLLKQFNQMKLLMKKASGKNMKNMKFPLNFR